MTTSRITNFNPGPAALPLPVLEEIREELLNCKGAGMSVLEMSHRAKEFEAILNDAIARIRRLLALDVQAAYESDPAATSPDEAITRDICRGTFP
ncbi:MAG: aminotransferase class V-fold PLP-dependent enzyme, partial [Desulfobacteraceae bacterium]